MKYYKSKITINLIMMFLAIFSIIKFEIMDIQALSESSIIDIDNKVLSGATIEENFTDNGVIVVLNRQATRNFRDYTVEILPKLMRLG